MAQKTTFLSCIGKGKVSPITANLKCPLYYGVGLFRQTDTEVARVANGRHLKKQKATPSAMPMGVAWRELRD